jgi:hypothetical protein
MPIDREFWSRTSFYNTKFDVPEWQCPTCAKSMLRLVRESLHDLDDASSVRNSNSESWDPGQDTGVFSCLFKCQNNSCKETVSVCGEFDTDRVGEYGDYEKRYYPKMFFPAMLMMPIPKKCPENVADEIRAAFLLYWCDISGALNHLRKSVELIMGRMKIPKMTAASKSKPITLHQRIDIFRKSDKDLADRLEAIKWLGNFGSHSAKAKQKQFFDACDLLEDFVQTHFEKRGKRIVALTASTIKKKGR